MEQKFSKGEITAQTTQNAQSNNKYYYKYQWFFRGTKCWNERPLGCDKNEALQMAQDDFSKWLSTGKNIEDSGMVVYEVDSKTHTPYNEDRTVVGRVGNLSLIQYNPEISWI